MKRLIFCFDGTWNQLSRPNPTNVAIVAESITPLAKHDVIQIIHYDAGVGTGHEDHWRGGVLGEGLLDKIVDAYTFLVFNYHPGDDILVFGFSRGAFTARAFVGFIRNLGIVARKHAGRIGEAVALYHQHKAGGDPDAPALLQFRWKTAESICISTEEDAWRVKTCPGYATGQSPVIRIRYLGVWDTVAALGIPNYLPLAAWVNEHEQYFDAELNRFVVSARHAVSIDEDRRAFSPTLWPNFQQLNALLGYEANAPNAPYQQKWFPGDHGSVGGGGDIRGLSSKALSWVLDGALAAGLEVDQDPASPLYADVPNPYEQLTNGKAVDPTLLGAIEDAALPKAPRLPGPQDPHELSDFAVLRWQATADQLPEKKLYRPPTLAGMEGALAAAPKPKPMQSEALPVPPGGAATPGTFYRVRFGEGLRAISQRAYGHADREDIILKANPVITDPDRIYDGQLILLPLAPAAPTNAPPPI